MKVHILQHTADTTPGSTLQWLKEQQIKYSITKFFEPNPVLPDISSFDFLIICGGEMNVDQENQYPWMKAEKELIKNSLEQNKKVLGLCLGGQLMAEALGARVGKHKTWEVGWLPINLKPTLPLNLPTISTLTVFQYHGYSFDTPASAKSFASSPACEHQGFIYGTHAVGLQFHSESTMDWVRQCATEKLPSGIYVQTAEEMIAGNTHQKNLQEWYFSLLTALKNS